MGANPLSRLIKQADAASETASVLLKRTIREIRHDLADLSPSLNLAGSADDREKAYNLVRRRFARLSRLLDTLMADANTAAAKAAAKAAGQMTGLEVKYSPSRAKAICELVTPAQGENLAAVFTDKMSVQLINSLREATVATLRDQAVIGGTLKDMKRDLADRWALAAKVENPTFTDASGRRWDTQTYFQMNVRTNTMRVYNDCLVDDVAREVGTDVMRISTGGDPDCACAAWEGCIISVSGKTKGLPTYEDARNGGCFHPNCTHTLEYVDEVADADEIALQKGHPAQKGLEDDPDAQDERKYEIDQARYMRDNPGMTQEQARVAVDRDNLAASIQSGLIREDAREIVSKMTDAQVTALCPNGNPPSFEPVKRVRGGTRAEPKHEPERWNHGSRGGVVHIKRDADFAHILSVTKADKTAESRQNDENGHRSARNAPDDKSTAKAEKRDTMPVSGEMPRITPKELLAEAKNVESGKRTDFKPSIIATIDDSTAKRIEKEAGIVPKGRSVTIAEDEIVHTFGRHGKPHTVNGRLHGERNKKQIPITSDDFRRVPDIIKDADAITAGTLEKSRKLPTVKFSKTFADGTNYTVFVLADNMEYKTMWKRRK